VFASSIAVLAATSSSSGSSLSILLFFVVMAGIFYLLLIRPQQRQRRTQRNLLESLAVGDEVVTIGGIHGVIRTIDDDDTVVVEVSPGVDMRFLRGAIARKLVYDDTAGTSGPSGELPGASEKPGASEGAGDQT
jgi:preprotein translocase subunit YajC